ncbi:hypothetical protein [Corallococcus silvisoli]|uniref:hypothetical protein n=1 Tax=Corallococcus silvisoli TaxID=2697031 RepID=UPI00137703D4|nr:hypothetical protein [Corallococcus silvisoli]NBD09500.1 hypothetical protein [Corallococcus silvisoli]
MDLSPVDPDEPEERTLMAIPTVESPEPGFPPPPELPLAGFDEPEERTLMAIPATPDVPSLVAEPSPHIAPSMLPASTMDEPEERTMLDLRPITPVSPLVAPPVRHSGALPTNGTDEPATFVGQDDEVPSGPPAEAEELVTFVGQDEPGARPPALAPPSAWGAPVGPPSPEPVTFVGRDQGGVSPSSWSSPAEPDSPELVTAVGRDQGGVSPSSWGSPAEPDSPELVTAVGRDQGGVPPSAAWGSSVPPPPPDPVTFVRRPPGASPAVLDPGLLPGEVRALALHPRPEADGDTTEPVNDLEASSSQPVPAGPITVVAKVAPSSAADKARQRRQLGRSLHGKFLLFWQRQSLPRRIGFASLGVLSVLALLALLVSVAPAGLRLPGREPFKLGLEPVTDSFGLGDGVRWAHADDKLFDFRFVSPTRAVAVLHYQASDISRDEVNLSLNGVSLGWVPPDTAQTAERELEQVLPPSLLRRNANNQLLFDNALNPPGRERWRIWNLRLEIIPVPEAPPDQLVASARESARAGARFYELKDVGAENLFKAWREYRAAWITLEALDEKPDLYEDVRERISQISTELDHRCGQLMMQFQRAVQFRSRRDAVATLEDVRRRFPTTEHRCHNLALEKAYEHEL